MIVPEWERVLKIADERKTRLHFNDTVLLNKLIGLEESSPKDGLDKNTVPQRERGEGERERERREERHEQADV